MLCQRCYVQHQEQIQEAPLLSNQTFPQDVSLALHCKAQLELVSSIYCRFRFVPSSANNPLTFYGLWQRSTLWPLGNAPEFRLDILDGYSASKHT
uniref:Uncharacterized protein n=1 Tax=Rhizophora mucronata TaxID=61149 RepID=A0A2P2MDW3_RHIMU